MTNEIRIFTKEEFGEIRTFVSDDGNVLFCGNDVAKSLGYVKPRNAITKYCKGASKQGILTNGGMQEVTFITEGDVYRLIARSKLPKAQKFESWVFDEVLPSIRNNGLYAIDELLDNPDVLLDIVLKLKEEREKRLELEEENVQLSNVIAEQKPKIEYFDTILQSPKALPITVIAQDYGMTCQQMNQLLKDLGIQYLCGGSWVLKSQYQGRGYTDSETKKPNQHNNQAFVHTKWTQKGRLFLYEKLKNAGYLPTIEQ